MRSTCSTVNFVHKTLLLVTGAFALSIGSIMAQSTYSGNGSTSFGGVLGGSSVTVSDNPANGTISFSLAATGSINNVAFYFSTGSGGVTTTSTITDTGDAGRRSISGQGTSSGHTNVNFAAGFSAKYAVAIDNSGNANLFQIVPGNANLTFVSGANYSHVGNTYGFSITETMLGITPGSSFNFVATLVNANDNGTNVFRSNETIGASNSDNNATGNLGNTGTLVYTGFDTYTTAVPEPATWLGAAFCCILLGRVYILRRRQGAVVRV